MKDRNGFELRIGDLVQVFGGDAFGHVTAFEAQFGDMVAVTLPDETALHVSPTSVEIVANAKPAGF